MNRFFRKMSSEVWSKTGVSDTWLGDRTGLGKGPVHPTHWLLKFSLFMSVLRPSH